MAVAVEELSDLQVSSKTQSPEKIAEVLKERGYDVAVVEQQAQQDTPEEIEAAAEAQRVAEAAEETRKTEEEEERVKSEGAKRRERQRLAKEADRETIRVVTERAERAERTLAEVQQIQTRMQTEIEDIRKNPPKVEPEPEAPKKPTRAEFIESDDPEEAYLDARDDWRRKLDTHERLLEERKNPKPPEAAVPAAAADPAPGAPRLDDDFVKTLDLEKIPDPGLKDFYSSVRSVTEEHPGAFKKIIENIPNVNDAIMQAGHLFDEPARIALYLAEHPDEAKRIKALTDGDPKVNNKLLRDARKELQKIEELAAAEDAAEPEAVPPAAGGGGTQHGDPETDLAAARHSPQPQQPAAPAAAPPAAAAPPRQKKATPIEPVGARGAQTAKSYDQMTPDEQRALSVDEVRALRNML